VSEYLRGHFDPAANFNADVSFFTHLPVEVLTVVALPAGVNARLPEAQCHFLLNFLHLCSDAMHEDRANRNQ